jgi:Tol biopolymer transport system component
MAPPALDRLVKICLAKEAEDRWQTAHDVALQLKWIAEGGSQAGLPAPVAQRRKGREQIWITLAALSTVTALALAAMVFLRPAPARSMLQFSVYPPEKTTWTSFNSMAISPDGRKLAFYADSENGLGRLWLRSMNSVVAQPLPGTEVGNASFPFFSPDSRFVGFFAERKLKRIDTTGGVPQVLCEIEDMSGGSWNSAGLILFSPAAKQGLLKISGSGGTPTPVTKLDASRVETGHLWPSFLPDGEHFLYYVRSAKREFEGIRVGSLEGGDGKFLMNADSGAVFVPPRHVLFMRGGALQVQEFDTKQLSLVGEPVLMAEKVGMNTAYYYGAFTASANGMIAYRSGASASRDLSWIDRGGVRGDPAVPSANYIDPELSPDGRRVAVALGDTLASKSEIWIVDLSRSVSSKLTFGQSDAVTPVWSPDGQYVYFASGGGRFLDIYRKTADGSGEEELVFKSEVDKYLTDVTPDGAFILFDTGTAVGASDMWKVSPRQDASPEPLLKTSFQEGQGRVSGDGKWLAYVSDESGLPQVYIRSFPQLGGKWQVSARGGAQPRWRRDGKEIYYLGIDGSLQAVPLEVQGASLQIGAASQLFTRSLNLFSMRNHYTPSGDGQRFFFTLNSNNSGPVPMTVLVNWDAEGSR